MIYLGLKDEQLKAIYNNGGVHSDNVYLLVFSDDDINVTIEFKNIKQFKKFMFYLQNSKYNNIELDCIKSFIDPDKRKDE